MMRARKPLLIALALAAFSLGFNAQAANRSQAGNGGNAANGKAVFAKAGCSACHGDQGQGANTAPPLAPPGLDLEHMTRYVRQPSGAMPAVSAQAVSDQDLADVYAFLKSIAPGKTAESLTGDAQKGKQLFSSVGCYECHGLQGQGGGAGARIGPPPVSIVAFTQYVHHPGGQMPPYTNKVISDQDLADIYAFLKTISPPPAANSFPALTQ